MSTKKNVNLLLRQLRFGLRDSRREREIRAGWNAAIKPFPIPAGCCAIDFLPLAKIGSRHSVQEPFAPSISICAILCCQLWLFFSPPLRFNFFTLSRLVCVRSNFAKKYICEMMCI